MQMPSAEKLVISEVQGAVIHIAMWGWILQVFGFND
jgi:hypothetical protein